MTEDTPIYNTQDTENEDQSLFTSALKDSLFFSEDLEISNDNDRINFNTTGKTTNENYEQNMEHALKDDTSPEDKNLKKAHKIRFIKKQPAPSTLQKSLGRIIGQHSLYTPIARRELFKTTPTISINKNDNDDDDELSEKGKELEDVPHPGKSIIITNPYTGQKAIIETTKETPSNENTDTYETQQKNNDDRAMALNTPHILHQNILTQTFTPLKDKQKSIKSILHNKIQVSNVSSNKLVLPIELETLKNVMLSQHAALAPHIQELGNICLHFTNLIEKKKESSKKLLQDNRIPRSLRVKCELSTSPDYENNPDFINLKQTLQNIVSNFTTQGLEVMKEWSLINIKLLIKDRCHNILKKALSILDGLQSYWTDILKPIDWPNNLKKHNLLLLTKIFFTTDFYSNIDTIVDFLELSSEDIMILISKILHNHNNDDTYHKNLINSIDLSLLEKANEKQLTLITETLSSFEQIFYATTTELWEANLQKHRALEASLKLKAKMETERLISATETTAKAIDKAVGKINEDNNIHQDNQLRLLNLEKQAAHQKQLALEILNHIKTQKNSKRGQHGSLTSQEYNKNPFHSDKINIPETIDLTLTQSQSPIKHSSPQPSLKKRKQIQWDDTQTKAITFHPTNTPTNMFGQSTTLMRHPKHPTPTNIITQLQTTNPFISTPSQIPQTNQKSRGGRTRGRGRGYYQR